MKNIDITRKVIKLLGKNKKEARIQKMVL